LCSLVPLVNSSRTNLWNSKLESVRWSARPGKRLSHYSTSVMPYTVYAQSMK
jgi:hypothetical protein